MIINCTIDKSGKADRNVAKKAVTGTIVAIALGSAAVVIGGPVVGVASVVPLVTGGPGMVTALGVATGVTGGVLHSVANLGPLGNSSK